MNATAIKLGRAQIVQRRCVNQNVKGVGVSTGNVCVPTVGVALIATSNYVTLFARAVNALTVNAFVLHLKKVQHVRSTCAAQNA